MTDDQRNLSALHFIWNHTEGLDEPWLCWCGEDHPDEQGRLGRDKYIAPDDPGWVTATEEHLDSLYLDAMLGEHDQAVKGWPIGGLPLRAPGMTDLMVTPESIDKYLAENPPPEGSPDA